MSFHAVILSLLLILALLTGGCALQGLREDLEVMARTSRIEGSVIAVPATGKPVCVLLLRTEAGTPHKVLVSHHVVYPPGGFYFMPPPGEYFLLAFEDANEDLTLQPNERVGWYGAPTPVKVNGHGGEVAGLEIMLRTAAEARRELPQLYAPTVPKISIETTSGHLHVGDVMALDDPRFSEEAGRLGMWEPVKFLLRYGTGVFLLEPYDRKKIPVLFVHGVGGSPRSFGFLIDQMDRTRFQPWVAHYPSGLRLSLLSELLARHLRELQLRHGFARMDIVAHSMGGLVAREAINQLTRQGSAFVGAFVSLSSPWQGHPGSRTGVEHSPVILPCWYDMAPGSPFLKGLQETPLPKETTYCLLFGHKGDAAMFAGESTDGTLPLSSMADLGMQDSASKVLVFNETHDSILTSSEVAIRLNQLLASPVALPVQSP